MTLDETIKCTKEIAEWLEDYKRLLAQQPNIGYWREVDRNEYACSNCNRTFSIVPEYVYKNKEKNMSIFIKTMTDLPKHCYECPCHDKESGRCQVDKEHGISFDRPSWCPLVKTESEIRW